MYTQHTSHFPVREGAQVSQIARILGNMQAVKHPDPIHVH